jgi:hypothetical protein
MTCIPDGRPAGLGGDCEVQGCEVQGQSVCMRSFVSSKLEFACYTSVICSSEGSCVLWTYAREDGYGISLDGYGISLVIVLRCESSNVACFRILAS